MFPCRTQNVYITETGQIEGLKNTTFCNVGKVNISKKHTFIVEELQLLVDLLKKTYWNLSYDSIWTEHMWLNRIERLKLKKEIVGCIEILKQEYATVLSFPLLPFESGIPNCSSYLFTSQKFEINKLIFSDSKDHWEAVGVSYQTDFSFNRGDTFQNRVYLKRLPYLLFEAIQNRHSNFIQNYTSKYSNTINEVYWTLKDTFQKVIKAQNCGLITKKFEKYESLVNTLPDLGNLKSCLPFILLLHGKPDFATLKSWSTQLEGKGKYRVLYDFNIVKGEYDIVNNLEKGKTFKTESIKKNEKGTLDYNEKVEVNYLIINNKLQNNQYNIETKAEEYESISPTAAVIGPIASKVTDLLTAVRPAEALISSLVFKPKEFKPIIFLKSTPENLENQIMVKRTNLKISGYDFENLLNNEELNFIVKTCDDDIAKLNLNYNKLQAYAGTNRIELIHFWEFMQKPQVDSSELPHLYSANSYSVKLSDSFNKQNVLTILMDKTEKESKAIFSHSLKMANFQRWQFRGGLIGYPRMNAPFILKYDETTHQVKKEYQPYLQGLATVNYYFRKINVESKKGLSVNEGWFFSMGVGIKKNFWHDLYVGLGKEIVSGFSMGIYYHLPFENRINYNTTNGLISQYNWYNFRNMRPVGITATFDLKTIPVVKGLFE